MTAVICYIFAGIVFGGGVVWKIQELRVNSYRNTLAEMSATLKAQGEAAKKVVEAVIARDNKLKERTDNDHKVTIDKLNADIKRLRDNRPRTSFVPTAPASARSPEVACFDRSELESAIRDFDAGIQRLVDEGSARTVDLDSAKQWAQN